MAEDKKPEALADLWRLAVEAKIPSDLGRWLFIEAKAVARMEIAERRLKRMENEDYFVRCKASGMDTASARELILSNAPDHVAWYTAETALADAIEAVTVCNRMIAILTRPRSGAPDKPNHLRAVPAVGSSQKG